MTTPGRARDVARVALFLASSDSDFVTGEGIVVDGGPTARPFSPRAPAVTLRGMDQTSDLIGSSPRRKEDRRLLVGAGRYLDDITREGMLHLGVVRSPHAPRAHPRRSTRARRGPCPASSRRGAPPICPRRRGPSWPAPRARTRAGPFAAPVLARRRRPLRGRAGGGRRGRRSLSPGRRARARRPSSTSRCPALITPEDGAGLRRRGFTRTGPTTPRWSPAAARRRRAGARRAPTWS